MVNLYLPASSNHASLTRWPFDLAHRPRHTRTQARWVGAATSRPGAGTSRRYNSRHPLGLRLSINCAILVIVSSADHCTGSCLGALFYGWCTPCAGPPERLAHATFIPQVVHPALGTRLRLVFGQLVGPTVKCSHGGHAGGGKSTRAVTYRGITCSRTLSGSTHNATP